MNIIDGKGEAEILLCDLSEKVRRVHNLHNIRPTLAIILIGDNPASLVYVRNKVKAAERVGINAIKIELPDNVSSAQLFKIIDQLNNDQNTSGIIIQLPIPQGLDKDKILSSILPEKDVDGFHPINSGRLHNNMNTKYFTPGTALGCLYLAEKYEPNLSGKHIVIVGRSNIVGRPLSALFLNRDCTVTVCHSKTQNLHKITQAADVVVTAIGQPALFTADYFNKNSIVIDVGMNRSLDGTLIGDVDFQNVRDFVRYITPVPGGVGPMTVVFLLINTFNAMLSQHSL